MKIASVKTEKILDLCRSIRELKSLPLAQRVAAVNELLRSIDAVRLANDSDLLCITHAAELHNRHPSNIYRAAQEGHVAMFTICCRAFFSRKEIEGLKQRRTGSGGWNKGMPKSVR